MATTAVADAISKRTSFDGLSTLCQYLWSFCFSFCILLYSLSAIVACSPDYCNLLLRKFCNKNSKKFLFSKRFSMKIKGSRS